MQVYVANPIYDSVFKYIMEDDRIAKTILSALLKKDIVSVEVRPHEYANETQDKISMFRIDFGARIKEPDGTTRLILIELQKTWLETETLRFRQYLGAQYSSKRNIDENSAKGFAYPMVSIYLMGHRVGNINVPVLYVNHKAYDYNGKEVTQGMPDPFVESLVHDSIIVQIPLLHGKINKRLDRVLSVFDQSKADSENPQLLCLDDDVYDGDDDMQYVVHRLTAAAASPRMRQDMNVEDEYYSAIENRDTELMRRDKALKEKESQLQEKDSQLQEKDSQLQEKDSQLQKKDSQLQKKDSQLQEKDSQLQEKNSQLQEKDSQLQEKNSQLQEKDSQLQKKDSQLQEKDSQLQEKDSQLQEKDSQLKNLLQAMIANGSTISSIATVTGISEDKIKDILSEKGK